MWSNRAALVILLTGVNLGLWFAPARATDQVRLKNSISVSRGASTDITFTQESRFGTFTLFDDHYLSAYYLDITSRIAAVYYSSFGFRRQDTDLETFTSHESRVYLQGGRKQRLAGLVVLDTRARIEYRRFREPILDDYFRFRARFKLGFETHVAGAKITPFVSDELFGDDRAGSKEFLKRSRTLAGFALSIGGHAGCEVSYMLENNRDAKPLTALIAGIQITL